MAKRNSSKANAATLVSTVAAIVLGSVGFSLLSIAVFSWNDHRATTFVQPLKDQPWA